MDSVHQYSFFDFNLCPEPGKICLKAGFPENLISESILPLYLLLPLSLSTDPEIPTGRDSDHPFMALIFQVYHLVEIR